MDLAEICLDIAEKSDDTYQKHVGYLREELYKTLTTPETIQRFLIYSCINPFKEGEGISYNGTPLFTRTSKLYKKGAEFVFGIFYDLLRGEGNLLRTSEYPKNGIDVINQWRSLLFGIEVKTTSYAKVKSDKSFNSYDLWKLQNIRHMLPIKEYAVDNGMTCLSVFHTPYSYFTNKNGMLHSKMEDLHVHTVDLAKSVGARILLIENVTLALLFESPPEKWNYDAIEEMYRTDSPPSGKLWLDARDIWVSKITGLPISIIRIKRKKFEQDAMSHVEKIHDELYTKERPRSFPSPWQDFLSII